ncbi:MAG: FHA domain-containing protein [Planctomycetes bacterium]|nr:FHA domain-containing protein [Planctomycetota bacterium]
MRLIVKREESVVSEFRFEKGPVRIGRHAESQILLPEIRVSRRHAVITGTEEGGWNIEDLGSASRTYLNGKFIKTADLKTGDIISIYNFTIEVDLDEDGPEEDILEEDMEKASSDDTKADSAIQATLATPPHEVIVRKADSSYAPAMRLDGKRIAEFSMATEKLRGPKNFDELLLVLLDLLFEQFDAYHVWCALRKTPDGPMTHHAGRRRDGKLVELVKLPLAEKINQAVERGQFLVLPRVSAQVESERVRSALIAPIKDSAGCFGVLYVDNAMIKTHYALGDLDYLIFLAIYISAMMKNL